MEDHAYHQEQVVQDLTHDVRQLEKEIEQLDRLKKEKRDKMKQLEKALRILRSDGKKAQ